MNRFILLLCVSMASVTIQAQAPKPNVVFVMTDDMGYSDIGPYGGTDIRTPVLDRLAREGVRFTDFYANGPVCSPTRAGLITGRYQQRYGIEAPLPSSDPENRVGLPATGHSLPQLMKDAGYRTGLIGKWHLGLGADKSPRAHGFEHFFGFKSGYIDYYTHNSGSGEPDLWLNDAPTKQDGYFTDLITAHSVDFIRSSADKPFFLSVQYNAPHWPYQVPDKPSVAIRNAAHLQPHDENTGTREQYVAMLERVDQGIGEILAALEKAGVARNTLVIFTNDNGGEWLANNSPLFHRKWTVWEGGIRVPAIMRWPGVIPAGQVTPQVGITMDFTATMLALAGARKPEGYVPEGIDLLPIVTGRSPVVDRTLFWRTTTARAVRSGDLKLVVDGGSTLVFNVREDLGENRDLTNSRQQDARRLRGMLDAWVKDVDAERQVRAPAPPARPAAPPAAAGACNRACLEGHVNGYLAALTARDPGRLQLARDVRFTENGTALKLGEGLWKTAASLTDYRIHVADPQAGQAGFVGTILQQDGKPMMLALRLRVVDGLIREVETVTGPPFQLPGASLMENPREAFARTVPREKRLSRAALVAAADRNFDNITAANGSHFTADCQRVENRLAMSGNPQLDYPIATLPERIKPRFAAMGCREQVEAHLFDTLDSVGSRRYLVIDEERQLVFGMLMLNWYRDEKCNEVSGYGRVCRPPDQKPTGLRVAEILRVDGGQVGEVEVVFSYAPYQAPSGWEQVAN